MIRLNHKRVRVFKFMVLHWKLVSASVSIPAGRAHPFFFSACANVSRSTHGILRRLSRSERDPAACAVSAHRGRRATRRAARAGRSRPRNMWVKCDARSARTTAHRQHARGPRTRRPHTMVRLQTPFLTGPSCAASLQAALGCAVGAPRSTSADAVRPAGRPRLSNS